ncbi:hypothetical protein [Rhizobium sp. P28RR-XV]|uniref:hypothetical protein n=1 Tax=Rhizobium sp. P28RR-XV TaxID=2726737 RepID=UPI001FEDDEC3|nr:hypothetical protein [Rhizobium sp. P28RR-XV]
MPAYSTKHLEPMEYVFMTSFIEKWSAKKAEKPKAGTRNALEAFRLRVAQQKDYLEEYERDTAGFKKWRSTWFQRVPGGFGVSIGRDAISAGDGLSYVVVDSAKEVAEFLDDLLQHAEHDVGFQIALENNRARRAAVLNAAKAQSSATKSVSAKSPAKAPRAKPGPRAGKSKANN